MYRYITGTLFHFYFREFYTNESKRGLLKVRILKVFVYLCLSRPYIRIVCSVRFFITKVCSVRFLSLQKFVVCAFSSQKFVVCAFSSQKFVVCAFCHYKVCSVRFFTTKVCSVRFFAIAAALLFDIMHKLSFTSEKVILSLNYYMCLI